MHWPFPVRLAVAAGAGLGLALCFPPFGMWPLLPVVVAALTLACTGERPGRGALLGLVAGLGFFGLLLAWIRVVGADAWVALTVLQASFWALLGLGLAVVSRLPGWPAWAAGCWVLVEALRSAGPWGGFPWGRLAYPMVDSPLVGLATAGGEALLTAAAAALGALLAAAVVAVRQGRQGRAVLAAGLSAAVVLAGVVSGAATAPPPAQGKLTMAVVQGNVPRLGLDFFGQREAVLRNHVEATLALADDVDAGVVPAPDVVLWPENSSDIDPFADPAAGTLISGAVSRVGVPTLVGVLVGTPDATQVENSAIVWDPVSGPGDRYVKRQPVPFGEYIPARPLLTRLIGRFDLVPRDMKAGDDPGVLTLGPVSVGVVICFEIAYDRVVRDVVEAGGEVIAVQTNNATYGGTGQPEQQFQISRLRAVEHGRDVVVASTSGISGVIDADGSVVVRTEEFTQEVLVESVDLRSALTWGTRTGGAVGLALAVLGAVGIVSGLMVGRRGRAARTQAVVVASS